MALCWNWPDWLSVRVDPSCLGGCVEANRNISWRGKNDFNEIPGNSWNKHKTTCTKSFYRWEWTLKAPQNPWWMHKTGVLLAPPRAHSHTWTSCLTPPPQPGFKQNESRNMGRELVGPIRSPKGVKVITSPPPWPDPCREPSEHPQQKTCEGGGGSSHPNGDSGRLFGRLAKKFKQKLTQNWQDQWMRELWSCCQMWC